MYMQLRRWLAIGCLAAIGLPAVAAAQDVPAPAPDAVQAPVAPVLPVAAPALGAQDALSPIRSACGNALPSPAAQPPDRSAAVLLFIELCFGKQGGTPILPAETYSYYIQAIPLVSLPSRGTWTPYTPAVEQTIRDDFKRLWDQGFLDDLSIEVNDYTFPNGVTGRVVSYHIEERERIKTVRYDGSKEVDRTKIEEQLRERNLVIAADSFVDEAKIRRVSSVVGELMREKGFNAEVTWKVEKVDEAQKTVNLTFLIEEGPQQKIKKVEFVGNDAFSDGKLADQMKGNKPTGFLSFVTGTGTVNQAKFEEDAERVEDFYQNHGYPRVRVSPPQIEVLEDSKDGKTQWISLRIPVSEGPKYNFGSIDFEGNTHVRTEYLQLVYDVKPGEIYNRKKIFEGHRRAQEAYGTLGFMEFTPFEDRSFSDQGADPERALAALVPPALAPLPSEATPEPPKDSARKDDEKTPSVDVTIRITEGEQFFVNRITFSGNTTTRDSVIRRELGTLLEGAPFNTEALKVAVRRVNQLGYFKPLEEQRDVKVDKVEGRSNLVDVTVKVEEENRNQLTFGAGISQYEGFFGQLAFSTSNFLGRGESLTLSFQGGERAKNYQLGFTEPYLFDRNITGGLNVFKRELQYIGYYTQKSSGASIIFGKPLSAFTRAFVNYSYETVSISDLNEALINNSCLITVQGCDIIQDLSELNNRLTPTQLEQLASTNNPYLNDALLLGSGGSRVISKVTPSLIHNTVDHPIFPTTGKKYTLSTDLAILGGNTQYIKPRLEGIWFFRHTNRTSFGFRAALEYIKPVRRTTEANMPVFERLFLGGEYSVRGFDIRSIGPTLPNSLVVLGGNKSLLFNAEYLVTIAGPVRLVLFADAGQVQDFGDPFSWKQDITELVFPTPPPLGGLGPDVAIEPNLPGITERKIGEANAFKTSTGVEVRFFMPVLNVPFRLIYAWNPSRAGVLDNNLAPAKSSVFRFAVGTTF
jgi:outer membrane protein insertion porin family